MHSLTSFILKAVEITRADYEPSDIDILHAEGITLSNGIASVEFSFPKSVQDSYMDTTDHDDPLKRFGHKSSLFARVMNSDFIFAEIV